MQVKQNHILRADEAFLWENYMEIWINTEIFEDMK